MEPIGRYQVLGELGRGGMGVVLRALDPERGEEVALKLLLQPDSDPRFRVEARAVARLRHPGIVSLLDAARDERGRDFLVMELVPGGSLQARLERDGPLPLEQAVDYAIQLCRAVEHAHRSGVIHRDLKPHNALIGPDDTVKLTDFGLARVVDQSQALTRTGQLLGTPAYMAPEQAEGDVRAVGPTSDVYGLGATLYALLTGQPPFVAQGAVALLRAVLQDPPLPPSLHRPGIPARLDAIVLRALAKAPEQRHPTPEALARDLEAWAAGGAERPRPHRAAGALAIVGLGALGALAIAWPQSAPPPGPPPFAGPELPAPVNAGGSTATPEPPGSEQAPPERTPAQGPTERPPATPAGGEVQRLLDAGALLGDQGNLPGAIEAFGRAIELEPDRAQTYRLRALARARADDPAGAAADFERALALDPGDVRTWRRRAELRRDQRDLEGAASDIERALALDPADADAWFLRAELRYARRDLKGALADADRALELRPNFASACYSRGTVRFQLGDLAGASEDFTRCLALRPKDAGAYRNRGTIREGQGDLAGAGDDFTAAIAIHPDDPRAWSSRASLRARQGDLDGAIADATRALQLRPDDPSACRTRGNARFERGELEGALADLERAVQLDPRNGVSYYLRARTRARLGDASGAAADYTEALRLAPDAGWAAQARQHLQELTDPAR